ncbi:MAG: membrane dipeptidase [Candidatus Hydrogenedentota bacterium]
MMNRIKANSGKIVTVIVLIAGLFFVIVPTMVDSRTNAVRSLQPHIASDEAQALHDTLIVADLHADSLLFGRDLVHESQTGHVDLPRMRRANVALQAFTVVTKSPEGQNIESNSTDASDRITLLTMINLWPIKAWFSLKERALYQARMLHRFERQDDHFRIIKTVADLDALLEDRKSDPDLVGGFLGIEGLHCLEGDAENLQVMIDAGFRMMAATHFFDNELGGSAHGESGEGLSDFGREIFEQLEANNILIDLAHVSPAMIDDILAITTKPLVVSHTGVKGTCDNVRNISDDHVKGIAANGGVIGIGLWETAVCGTDASATAAACRYVAELVGVDHVAIGSDYDGAVEAPFDITGFPLITEALMVEGFSGEEIAKIMGGNTIRVLRETLPTG